MSPTPVPTRITIDFRDAVYPSRSWILGVDDQAPDRVELIAFDVPTATSAFRSTALAAECACPEYCERDHANE